MFQQVATIERFHQEGDGTIPQCLLANVIVIMGRDEDDRQLTPFASNPPLQFRPVYAGQTHVCDDTRHARKRTGQQKSFRGFEGDGFVSGGFENALNRLSNTTIVVHRCDDPIRLRHQVTFARPELRRASRDAPFCIPGIVRTARTPG
jgi:hypothetical protein